MDAPISFLFGRAGNTKQSCLKEHPEMISETSGNFCRPVTILEIDRAVLPARPAGVQMQQKGSASAEHSPRTLNTVL